MNRTTKFVCSLVWGLLLVTCARAAGDPQRKLSAHEVSRLLSWPTSGLECTKDCHPTPSGGDENYEPDFVPLDEWKQKVLDEIKGAGQTHLDNQVLQLEESAPSSEVSLGFTCYHTSALQILVDMSNNRAFRTCPGQTSYKTPFSMEIPSALTSEKPIPTKFPLEGDSGIFVRPIGKQLSNRTLLAGLNSSNEKVRKRRSADEPLALSSEGPSRPATDQMQNTVEIEVEHEISQVQDGRFNFASFDAGARILGSNEGSSGAKNILTSDRDRYMLSPCFKTPARLSDRWQAWLWESERELTNRWTVVELSEDILMRSLDVANYEFYSSSPSKITLFGSQTFPQTSNKWRKLGSWDFTLMNGREKLELISAKIVRYLNVSFEGALDSEYYCTISEVRVFGDRLLDDWRSLLTSKEPSTATDDARTSFGESGHPANEKSQSSNPDESPRRSLRDKSAESGAIWDPAVPAYEDFKRLVGGVAADAFGGDDEESIFRRVTRMIRMLELNQSLTNHYIDTHLKKYAVSLQETRSALDSAKRESAVAKENLEKMAGQLAQALSKLESGPNHSSWRTEIIRGFALFLVGLLASFCGIAIQSRFFERGAKQTEEITPLIQQQRASRSSRARRARARKKARTLELEANRESVAVHSRQLLSPFDMPEPEHLSPPPPQYENISVSVYDS